MQAAIPRERVFLSAEWRDLLMLNYEVEPHLLHNYVPRGTELDSFNGRTLISLVGFRFLRTKLFGALLLPFHTNFDEINLRIYVRRHHPEGDRRGVVFIREIVPRRAIAYLARAVYGEKYSRFPMRHHISSEGARKSAEYEWLLGSGWCVLRAQAEGEPVLPLAGSLEQIITEHYWGYTAARNRGCLEYHVTHEPWRVWTSRSGTFTGDTTSLYGAALGSIIRGAPHSSFIAEGSPVLVYTGRRIQ